MNATGVKKGVTSQIRVDSKSLVSLTQEETDSKLLVSLTHKETETHIRIVSPINLSDLLLCPFLRSSHQRCSIRKGVLRNFTKFTGKHLCQSLFFNKVAGSINIRRGPSN